MSDGIFSCLDTMHKSDRQTNRQTDRQTEGHRPTTSFALMQKLMFSDDGTKVFSKKVFSKRVFYFVFSKYFLSAILFLILKIFLKIILPITGL